MLHCQAMLAPTSSQFFDPGGVVLDKLMVQRKITAEAVVLLTAILPTTP
jgi:hypothetical protein